MADIFVSYTNSDRDWAFWIGQELIRLGHKPRIHEWEIDAGGDVPKWMEERLQAADRVLCVVSDEYLAKDYSGWERRSAQWAAASKRPNFMLPVLAEDCEPPVAMAHIKRCSLFGIGEDDARARLEAYLAEAKPPSGPVAFPGKAKPLEIQSARSETVPFPGARAALSNIPIAVPRHFLGRDDALQAIDAALKLGEGRVAITALHGLRGVGKTTLAAAYAERRRADYRATWWTRAQTESTMRADLVALGVRLGWVAPDEKEEPAVAAVRERLRDEGEGLLLIYDNAIDPASLRPYLPTGGAARVLVTSNAHAWRGVAAPVEIRGWPRQVGADYLIARTGRDSERADAEALSEALGGLPLAHEQAAAYCERLEVSLAEYRRRFDAAPARLLDDARHAPAEYHDGRTVAKTFALAIDEAAKLHPAAEPLIAHAAVLAAEPIPLFLFSEGGQKFGEPLASQLAGDGLDEAVAALRAFALVDRESIPDERIPSIVTDTIRLHRLVRMVAAERLQGDAAKGARRVLIEAMAGVYPGNAFGDPSTWPRARRLDALAFDLVGIALPPASSAGAVGALLSSLASYRQAALANYAEARPLFERALAIYEESLGFDDPSTATCVGNLAVLLEDQGDFTGARVHFGRALAIRLKALGPMHPDTANSLNNFASFLLARGDFANARLLYEHAVAVCETALGTKHPYTATCIDNLAALLQERGDLAGAWLLNKRALDIREKVLGLRHPDTSASLNNLGIVVQGLGDLAGARLLFERALGIREEAMGPEHPLTNLTRNNLARLRLTEGFPSEALPMSEAALAALEKVPGANHRWTKWAAAVTGDALDALGRADEAAALRARCGLGDGSAA